MSKIQLNPSSILKIPLHTYAKDFTFIVNGEEFKTSRVISELISSKVCKIHQQDPTIDEYVINTQHRGDFSEILQLSEFKEIQISEERLDFFIEVIEELGNETFEIDEICKTKETKIDKENVIDNIKKHERFKHFYYKILEREIEFASSHFFELFEHKKEEISGLNIDTIYDILDNEQLVLESEDQLIEIINELYLKDRKYSILYETVRFENLTSESIKEFIQIFDYNEMSKTTWYRLSIRLQEEINNKNLTKENKRYAKKGISFSPKNNNEISGIINYLRTQNNNQIENEINITVSSFGDSSERNQPKTVILYENKNNYYYSKNNPNEWLCIEFKNHQIIPTDYTIRSLPFNSNDIHLKNWILEGSTDNKTWHTLDEKTNFSELNGNNYVHTFHINNTNKYRFLRIKETGLNWRNDNYLSFNCIEFYGNLI